MDTKKINWVYVVILVAIVAIAGLHMSSQEKTIVVNTNSDRDNLISVTGESERFVAPDTASVSFTMTRKSAVLSEATESVNQRIADLLKSLGEDGVKESDIKTTNYSVNPEYQYLQRERTFDGYRVNQSVTVKIRDLDKVNDVLTKIGQLKVDNVSGLTFFIEDDEKIREELREEAIKNAKKKAQILAADLGIELKEIVGFSEGNNRYYAPVYSSRALAFDTEDADFSVQASIPTGENQLNSSVTITYKIN